MPKILVVTLVCLGFEKDTFLPGRNKSHSHPQGAEGYGEGMAVAEETRFDVPGYTVRTPRYRYTEWNGGKDGLQLYDLEKKDSGEFHNLAADPARADVIKEHKALLERVLKKSE